MKISKGLGTYAGLVGATGQYIIAIGLFLEVADVDPTTGLGALATATATLWKVIDGRMNQATALATRAPSPSPVAYVGTSSSSAPIQSNVSWGTASRAATSKPGEFDREPQAPPAVELRELPDCA